MRRYQSRVPYRYLVTLIDPNGALADHKIASAKADLAKVLPGQAGQTRRVYRLLSSRVVTPRGTGLQATNPGEAEPGSVDLSAGLQSVFGCVEFEQAACRLIRYLATAEASPDKNYLLGEIGSGWGKKFWYDTVPGIDPGLFAALCASGWVVGVGIPKRAFTVSAAFVRRVQQAAAQSCLGPRGGATAR